MFRHEAQFGPADGEVSGHFHPVAALTVRGRGLRRRCFLTDGQRLILPAFGAYAGGLNALDPAIAQLFPDDYDALVVGRDAVRRLSWRQLRGRDCVEPTHGRRDAAARAGEDLACSLASVRRWDCASQSALPADHATVLRGSSYFSVTSPRPSILPMAVLPGGTNWQATMLPVETIMPFFRRLAVLAQLVGEPGQRIVAMAQHVAGMAGAHHLAVEGDRAVEIAEVELASSSCWAWPAASRRSSRHP